MKMNCIYVKRKENGDPILYGAYMEGSAMTVYLGTSDEDGLCQKIYKPASFPRATEQKIRDTLKDHPCHDFVGNIGESVITMAADWSKVNLTFA